MYLHEDKEQFRNLMTQVAAHHNLPLAIVEKDYYVTMILRLLASELPNCVFKGGTSLSKGFHAINRFSEDVDITFDEHIGESRRKKLKNQTIKGISDALGMPISNWDDIQSDRDYNAYFFSYESILVFEDDRMLQSVKLETALGSYAFPTENINIDNYVAMYLQSIGREEYMAKLSVDTFAMKVQALPRTYVDKVYAICDYYMQGKTKRLSRHMYDIFKLTPLVAFDDSFAILCKEVRAHRKQMSICPSAQDGVDVSALLMDICRSDYYKEDYEAITSYFANDVVPYEDAKSQLLKLAEMQLW